MKMVWIRIMQKFQRLNRSFLYRLLIKFLLVVVFPCLILWLICGMMLNRKYIDSRILMQQKNMENALSLLQFSVNSVSNVFIALEGNQEIKYFMEYQPNRSEMLYADFSSILDFVKKLKTMTIYLDDVRIYSDSSLLIYAPPFVDMKRDSLDEGVINKLEKAGINEIVWHFVTSDVHEFPKIVAYKKVYSNNYSKCIGYLEIQLSEQILSDYINIIYEISKETQEGLWVYHEKDLIYYTTLDEKYEASLYGDIENHYKILYDKNQYWNCLNMTEPELKFALVGNLSNINDLPYGDISVIWMYCSFLLLGILFTVFIRDMILISKRLLTIASVMRTSDPKKLLPIKESDNKVHKRDEIDEIIDAYNMLIRENNSLISQVQKMNFLTREAQYRLLKGQIHPHFVYGTLETMRMIAMKNKDTEVEEMLFSFSTLFRYATSFSNKDASLKEEIEIARHYLLIQTVRFSGRLDYEFQIDEELLEMIIPPFILQPIIENAILYGVSKTLDKCSVIVKAYINRDTVVISVSNDGLIISEQRLWEVNRMLDGKITVEEFRGNNHGIALHNIKERLNLFFDKKASMRLEIKEKRTTTIIEISKEECE